ncbi:hypothetical protein [Maribacter sp. 2307ULW6-5]|uniref:hypothetical protein n=1 Tax=Maribacter sp. 2307ULW6-5 TaxID=3386275 RepID=UPI0039BCB3C3
MVQEVRAIIKAPEYQEAVSPQRPKRLSLYGNLLVVSAVASLLPLVLTGMFHTALGLVLRFGRAIFE